MENGREEWREALAKNLTEGRRRKGLTQTELGERMNYSDKSVSKWERGEGVPDVGVLIKLGELYGKTPDELLGITPEKQKPVKNPLLRHAAVLLTMAAIVMLSALAAYILLRAVFPAMQNAWIAFIVALPVMFGISGAAFLMWKDYAWAFGALSIALWTACLSVQLCFGRLNPAFIYAGGGVLQLAAIAVCGFVLIHCSK
ncbi:MAG: helix-turn-helix domain-containing protein [Clostridia bacterium]|nr:helix-turn-helix domain-containing protein [Clostridia bacterium]